MKSRSQRVGAKPGDPYRDFADVYDAWQRFYPKPFSMAMAPLVRGAVRAHSGSRKVLVDLACGTGTFALWWKKTHPAWTVYGTDRSEAMIAAAQAEAGSRLRTGVNPRTDESGRKPSIRFLAQDLKDLSLPETVGVATCLFDSLNHVTAESGLRRIFRKVGSTLAPDGIFLFDLIDELAFPEVFTGSSVFDGPELYLGMETEYSEEGGIGFGMARFTFFRRKRSEWQRIDFRIRERRWFRGQIRDFLQEAGLDLIRLERINPYTSKDFFVPRTFWVCRRRQA